MRCSSMVCLCPFRHLINGCTIVQQQVDEVIYYHVELAAHDVILAEGLSCELPRYWQSSSVRERRSRDAAR